ncbi:tRNA lysidine(34) synthetase TilS [Sphingobacteriales bacterium UPWRP_1]|nr:tRNA lysidine(34) synthetase TilS [Sphingobacteriales bacterium TSM_CSM]PSJ78064.1 tRNA lysidine(34) synthetase TilS [Sphingobacteriales bacterium UPWRP_1]
MLAAFTTHLAQSCLVQKNNRLLLAVSGGVDSVVMCHLMQESNMQFGIAHCNFGLRGAGSDADEAFVQKLAAQYNVPFYSVQFNTLHFATQNKVSVQMAARALRYDWLEDIRQQNGYTFIATAHHQNDIAETMLLNLAKGTGLAGLHGIAAKSGKIVRPMLLFSKVQIEHFAQTENLPFRTDESNAQTKYVRNKIRHLVIPALKEINPALEETFYQNAQRFSEIEQVYLSGIEYYRKKLFQGPEKERLISIGRLLKIKPLQTVLYELLKPYHYNAAQVAQIIETLTNTPGKVFYSTTHQLIKDRKFLILSEKTEKDTTYTLIEKDAAAVEKTGMQLQFSYHNPDGFVIDTGNNIASLDAGKMEFPLLLRRWKNGDYFYPYGMNMKKKKLKRFFTDLKLSLVQKEAAWILTDNRGRICWVIGYRPDERFAITPKTKEICRIVCNFT